MEPKVGFNLIDRLQVIRTNLRQASTNAGHLEFKLLGPRPGDPKNEKLPSESVQTLIDQIGELSAQLLRQTTSHHEIIGDFGKDQCTDSATSTPRYA